MGRALGGREEGVLCDSEVAVTGYGGRRGQELAHRSASIALDMAKSGCFTELDIERRIAHGSPNVQSRQAVHMEGYARRTAQKAWGAPEVLSQRQEQPAKHPDRSPERGGPRRC